MHGPRRDDAGSKLLSRAIRLAFVLFPVFGVFMSCDDSQPIPSHQSILLFCGTGTSANDVAAFEALLNQQRLTYVKVASSDLNRMSVNELLDHRLLLVPGGHYINMGNGITKAATQNVNQAVHEGLNYLGVCAGGLLAGRATCSHFDLTSGVKFDFYAIVNNGVHKAPVWIDIAESAPQEHYWEDGPHFAGWGEVVATYPDHTPAVVQGAHGKGWILLCGIHPEAPEKWRNGMKFTTSTNVDNEFACKLIDSALHATPLPTQRLTPH